MCVTSEGEVYCWGWGRYGNIGDGESQDRHLPTLAKGLEGVKVAQVNCGWRHRCALQPAPHARLRCRRRHWAGCCMPGAASQGRSWCSACAPQPPPGPLSPHCRPPAVRLRVLCRAALRWMRGGRCTRGAGAPTRSSCRETASERLHALPSCRLVPARHVCPGSHASQRASFTCLAASSGRLAPPADELPPCLPAPLLPPLLQGPLCAKACGGGAAGGDGGGWLAAHDGGGQPGPPVCVRLEQVWAVRRGPQRGRGAGAAGGGAGRGARGAGEERVEAHNGGHPHRQVLLLGQERERAGGRAVAAAALLPAAAPCSRFV